MTHLERDEIRLEQLQRNHNKFIGIIQMNIHMNYLLLRTKQYLSPLRNLNINVFFQVWNLEFVPSWSKLYSKL